MGRPFYRLNRDLFHVQDQKASGNNGGTFTSGSWTTRTLQTIVTNELGVGLTANEVTGLKAGIYEAEGWGAVFGVANNQLRLYNVTGAAVLLLGTNEYANATNGTSAKSMFKGRFTLAATSTVRLEHRCATTAATNGFGVAASWGVEVYADLQIRFLGT